MKLLIVVVVSVVAVYAAPQKVFAVGGEDATEGGDSPRGVPAIPEISFEKPTPSAVPVPTAPESRPVTLPVPEPARDAALPQQRPGAGRTLSIGGSQNPNRSYYVHYAEPAKARTLAYENEQSGVGGYRFGFVTSDGISRAETGELVNAGTDQEFLRVRGVVTWFDYEGNEYEMRFIADENGFQPLGNYLKHRAQ